VGKVGENLPGLKAFDKVGLVEEGGMGRMAWRATMHRYFPHPRLAYVGDHEEAADSAKQWWW